MSRRLGSSVLVILLAHISPSTGPCSPQSCSCHARQWCFQKAQIPQLCFTKYCCRRDQIFNFFSCFRRYNYCPALCTSVDVWVVSVMSSKICILRYIWMLTLFNRFLKILRGVYFLCYPFLKSMIISLSLDKFRSMLLAWNRRDSSSWSSRHAISSPVEIRSTTIMPTANFTMVLELYMAVQSCVPGVKLRAQNTTLRGLGVKYESVRGAATNPQHLQSTREESEYPVTEGGAQFHLFDIGDQPRGNYGVEGRTVVNKHQPHIASPSDLQVWKDGVKDIKDGMVYVLVGLVDKLKRV